MIKKTLTLLILTSSFLSLNGAIEKGKKEIGLYFSANHYESDLYSSSSLGGDITLGYFQTENLELIGGVGASYVDSDLSDSNTFSALAGLRWYFNPEAKLLPFIGTQVKYYNSSSVNHTSFVAEGGLRQFLNENVSLDYILDYTNNPDFDSSSFSFKIGLSIFL